MPSPESPGYHERSLRYTRTEYKRRVIPQDWKADIDRRLTVDLLSANRYFAEENPNIAQLIAKELEKDPESFYQELTRRWDWHNQYYEKHLEPVIGEVLEKKSIALSPRRVDFLIETYRVSSLVDQATLVTTGAIKKYLERWSQPDRIGPLANDEKKMLFTPPVDSFMAEYQREHLRYILAAKNQDSSTEKKKEELLHKYHAGDEEIFEGRMKRFSKYWKADNERIEKEVLDLTIGDGYKIQHLYFTLERPRLKALRDIVTYDNREEYHILTSLIGVSGFVLRKRVLEYLDETKILINEGGIYEFSDAQVLEGLSKLRTYRGELMRKDVPGYAQSLDTCASASVMMALHSLFGRPLDRAEEMRLHESARSSFIPGAYFSALACEAAEAGACVELLHSEPGMFKNDHTFPPDVFDKLMKEYGDHVARAKKMGVKVENGVKLTEVTIRDYLQRDFIPVVAGMMGGFLHAIVVVGYSPDGLIVRDPLDPKPKIWKHGRLERYMQTDIGSWGMVIGKSQDLQEKFRSAAYLFERQALGFMRADSSTEQG